MFAVSLALVAQEFPGGPERGMAMGIYGATIGIAVAIGPLVGGLLTDGLGWEWVFLINVPIGIAAIAVTYWKLAESRDPNATRIDWGGLLTFSSALFLLVLALVRGNDEGWGSPLIVSLLVGAGRADGRLRRDRAAGRASRCCRSRSSAAAPSPACSWPPSRSPARCSRSSST